MYIYICTQIHIVRTYIHVGIYINKYVYICINIIIYIYIYVYTNLYIHVTRVLSFESVAQNAITECCVLSGLLKHANRTYCLFNHVDRKCTPSMYFS